LFKLLKLLTGKDKEYVKKGNKYFNVGNYVSAIYYYKKALKVNKNNKEAIEGINKVKSKNAYNQGVNYFIKGDYGLAKKELLKSMEYYENKESSELLKKINTIQDYIKKIKEAKHKLEQEFNIKYLEDIVEHCSAIVKLNKDDIRIINILNTTELILNSIKKIRKCLDDKNIIEAKKTMDKIKKFAKKYPFVIKHIDVINNEIMKEEAKKSFKEATTKYYLEEYYSCLELLENIKSVCENNKKFVELYDKVKNMVENIECYEKYFKEGNYLKAKEYLEKILKINPTSKYSERRNMVLEIINKLETAKLNWKTGEITKFIKEYAEIIKLNPDDQNIRECFNKAYKIYAEKIKNMDGESYKELLNETKLIFNYTKDLLDLSLESFENIIINSNNDEKYFELILYYWKLCGGTGLEFEIGFEDNNISAIELLGNNKILVFLSGEDVLKMSYVDLENNEIKWTKYCRNENYKLNIVNDDMILLSYDSGVIESIDINNGELLWEYKTWNRVSITDVLLTDKFLYVSCDYGHIYKISLKNGEQVSSYTVPSTINKIMELDNENIVAICGDPRILNSKWELYQLYTKHSSMYLNNKIDVMYVSAIEYCKKYGYLVVGSSNGDITVIRVNTGEVMWKENLKKYISALGIYGGGDTILIGTYDKSHLSDYCCCELYLYSINGSKMYSRTLNNIGIEEIKVINLKCKKYFKNKSSNNKQGIGNNTRNTLKKCLEEHIVLAKGTYDPHRGITPIYYFSPLNGNLLNEFRAFGNVFAIEETEKCYRDCHVSITYNVEDMGKIVHACLKDAGETDTYFEIYGNPDIVKICHESCRAICAYNNKIMVFDNSKAYDSMIILDRVSKAANIIEDYMEAQITTLPKSADKPLINKKYFLNQVSILKKCLKKKHIAKALEVLELLYNYIEECSNIELDVELSANELRKDAYNLVELKVIYKKGSNALYNVKISFSEHDFKVKNEGVIDILKPSETKSVKLYILPIYYGTYPAEIIINAEDEKGDELNELVLVKEITISGENVFY